MGLVQTGSSSSFVSLTIRGAFAAHPFRIRFRSQTQAFCIEVTMTFRTTEHISAEFIASNAYFALCIAGVLRSVEIGPIFLLNIQSIVSRGICKLTVNQKIDFQASIRHHFPPPPPPIPLQLPYSTRPHFRLRRLSRQTFSASSLALVDSVCIDYRTNHLQALSVNEKKEKKNGIRKPIKTGIREID